MTDSSNSTILNNPTTNSAGYVASAPTESKPAEPKADDFGYTAAEPKVEPAAEPKVEPVAEPVAEPKTEPVVENPATGYDDKNKVEPAAEPKAEPKTEPVTEPKTEDEIKKEFDGLLTDFSDKEVILDFAIKQKLTKEQVEAYVSLRKEEDARLIAKFDNDKIEARSKWSNELKEDKDFGGDDFDKNINRVEKVLENFMPNTKKVLTDTKGMLPPYIMRDLLSLSKTLNPTISLVSGDPSVPVVDESENFLEGFYK